MASPDDIIGSVLAQPTSIIGSSAEAATKKAPRNVAISVRIDFTLPVMGSCFVKVC
jgi:hypothetical protein